MDSNQKISGIWGKVSEKNKKQWGRNSMEKSRIC